MCEVCKPLSKVWDGSQRLLVSRFNNAKTGAPTLILVQENDEGVAQSVTIPVNFCPWCGEKLEWSDPDGRA